MNLILASGSPRRRELLNQMGLTFTVKPVDADESLTPGLSPREQVKLLSLRKAQAAAESFGPEPVILTADTVVVLDGKVLGKPANEEDAINMLTELSGRTHQVMTGVTVICGNHTRTFTEVTDIHFRDLTDKEIRAYVATGEPMDKAGSYGIQGGAALFCERMVGDYYNVMGLPVCRLGQVLKAVAPEVMEDTL